MKNKNLWIVIIIVLVIIAGLVVWSMYKNSNEAPPVTLTVTAVSNEPTFESDTNTNTENVKPVAPANPAVSLSYAQALVKYKDARLQLDKNCQASPDVMTFKNGASVMIDNRASVARTVKVGSTFTLKAFGFKIVKLSSASLPTVWAVDCDKSQNVARISIQK